MKGYFLIELVVILLLISLLLYSLTHSSLTVVEAIQSLEEHEQRSTSEGEVCRATLLRDDTITICLQEDSATVSSVTIRSQ